ncbi:MAG: hypothetical protein M3Q53_06390 [Actinomycetota bacterium]|nr:hypothetical protein [Actinomycetota bacterium]
MHELLLAERPDIGRDPVDGEPGLEAGNERSEQEWQAEDDVFLRSLHRLTAGGHRQASAELRDDEEHDQHDRRRALGRRDQGFDAEPADRWALEHVVLEVVALEHVVERDEDRELEQERKAGRERVDLVLLVEAHHLLLLALLVVLVLRLDRLELRLERLHRAHRFDLLQREGKDRQPDGEGQRDDRRPPAEAEVVEEDDDRLGDVGEDRRDRKEAHVDPPSA